MAPLGVMLTEPSDRTGWGVGDGGFGSSGSDSSFGSGSLAGGDAGWLLPSWIGTDARFTLIVWPSFFSRPDSMRRRSSLDSFKS